MASGEQRMYLDEEVIHYLAYYMARSEVENTKHKNATKQIRKVSDELLDSLYKPKSINVIRKERTKD